MDVRRAAKRAVPDWVVLPDSVGGCLHRGLSGILLLSLVCTPGVSATQGSREFCETETFRAQCGKNEIISMVSAKYGRMSIGRCVRKDLGYIGCFSDVLPMADRKCSGKSSCEVRIPDPDFDQSRPCLEELKTYLETSFKCIKVLAPDRHCDSGHRWKIPENITEGYISNSAPIDTSCGSAISPLIIKALPGQQINFTLLDFTLSHSSTHGATMLSSFPECQEYAVIFDLGVQRKVSVCGGTHRLQQIYLSTNNSVELYFRMSSAKQNGHRILLQFKVTGCVDITPSEGMWFRKYGNEAEVGCTLSRETWSLTCIEGQWKGTYGNCSASYHQDFLDVTAEPPGLHHGLTVVIIISLALGIGLLVLIGGILVLKRFHNNSKDSDSGTVEMHRIGDLEEEEHLRSNQDNEKTEYKDILNEICGGEPSRKYISISNRANDYIPSSFAPLGIKQTRPDVTEGDYGRCPNNIHVRNEMPVTLYAHSGGHRLPEPIYKTRNTDAGGEGNYGYNVRRCNQDCQGCHEDCDYLTRRELRKEIKSYREKPKTLDKIRSPCYMDEHVNVNHRTVCDLHRHNKGHVMNNSF